LAACFLSAFAARAGAGVVGLELARQNAFSSDAVNSAEALCPASKRALGGGGFEAASGSVVLDDLRPLSGIAGMRVQVVKDESAPDSSGINAFARCAVALPGLERVTATSPLSSANKDVTATCPAGKRLVGTGAEINAGGGQVVLDGIIPDDALTSVTAQGAEDQTGYSSLWSVTAHAICADPPRGLALARTTERPDIFGYLPLECGYSGASLVDKAILGVGYDSQGAPGEVRIAALGSTDVDFRRTVFRVLGDQDGVSTSWDFTGYAICADWLVGRFGATLPSSSATKTLSVTCPGQVLLGGGGDTTGALGEVALRNISASAFGDLRVDAVEIGPGTPTSWNLGARGICSSSLPGIGTVTSTSPSNSSTKTASVACPAGTRVLGAGGGVSAANGQVILDGLGPNTGLTAASATGVEVQGGYAGDWTVRVDAICALPLPGLELVSAASGLDSNDKSATAHCPGLKNLVGVGGDISAAGGQAGLNRVIPSAALDAVTVRANEDEDGYAGPWALTAFAVCTAP
jgi:hypothetical protein